MRLPGFVWQSEHIAGGAGISEGILKERRIYPNNRLESGPRMCVQSISMRRSFRTPQWGATSTQGCTLGWYAAPRWGANTPFGHEMSKVQGAPLGR